MYLGNQQFRVSIEMLLISLHKSDAPSGQPQVFWMERDIGQHLDTILTFNIQPDATPVSSKQGCLVLGSYNWSSAGPGEDAYFVSGKPKRNHE